MRNSASKPDDTGVIGPLIGLRRPRYELLHDILGAFLESQPLNEDVFIFVNLSSALRQLFSEYATAQLTRGELQRHPRVLAAELLNLAGHYRNYIWKHYGRNSTVLMYHSTQRSPSKLAISEDYKAAFYAKRLHGGNGEHEMLRQYVTFNLNVARQVSEFIPHLHVLDTGTIDPDAWPWLLAAEGRVNGPGIVLSSWDSDLQYTVAPVDSMSGRDWAVLRASGDHSRLIQASSLWSDVLKKTKDTTSPVILDPNHFLYALALAGSDDLSVPGIPRYGIPRAAKAIAKQVEAGRLPPDSVNLPALLEEAGLSEEASSIATRCWNLLVHDAYSATPTEMAAVDAQMVNRSGIGEIEQANARYFSGALSLELLFAGEGY